MQASDITAVAPAKEARTAAAVDRSDRFLIVGAGPAGLAQARAFARAGVAFDMVERHRDVGGIWDIDNPGTPMYRGARFISSKKLSAFIGFPMPAAYPDYPDHGQVHDYLRGVARAQGLDEAIEFGVEVKRIDPQDGFWLARFGSGAPRLYRGVVCANGMTWAPAPARYPGGFDGELRHSVTFRQAEEAKGRRVLIVGGGNSACDIACLVSAEAADTVLSLRRGYHVVPRHLFGVPADALARAMPPLPAGGQQRVAQLLLRLAGKPRPTAWPQPDHRIYESHPIINSEILDLVACGAVRVRPDIAAFDGRRVRFADGTAETFDLVLLATGYHMAIPFMDPAHFTWRGDRIGGYLSVFNERHPRLFTLGFLSTNAGVFADFDRLANLVANHALDQETKPDRAARFRAMIEAGSADLSGGLRFVASPRHASYVHHPTFRRHVERLRRRMGWPAVGAAGPAGA